MTWELLVPLPLLCLRGSLGKLCATILCSFVPGRVGLLAASFIRAPDFIRYLPYFHLCPFDV